MTYSEMFMNGVQIGMRIIILQRARTTNRKDRTAVNFIVCAGVARGGTLGSLCAQRVGTGVLTRVVGVPGFVV